MHGLQPCQEATDDWGTTWNSTIAGDVVTQDCKEEGYVGKLITVNNNYDYPVSTRPGWDLNAVVHCNNLVNMTPKSGRYCRKLPFLY